MTDYISLKVDVYKQDRIAIVAINATACKSAFSLFAVQLRKSKLRTQPTGTKKYLNHSGVKKSIVCDSGEISLFLR